MVEYWLEYSAGNLGRYNFYYSEQGAQYIENKGLVPDSNAVRGRSLTTPQLISNIEANKLTTQGSDVSFSGANDPIYIYYLGEPTTKQTAAIYFYPENNVKDIITTPTMPTITISSEVQAILLKFENNDYIFPSWFENNIKFVKTGEINSNEFLNSFNNLLQTGVIVDKTIQVEPKFCINVYTLDLGGNVLSEHFDSINAQKFEELTNQGNYIFLCEDGIIPSEQQVRDFYGYTAPVEDSSINSTMVSQSVGAFILKDGRLKGEILYIANTAFNPFYYDKNLTSLVQIKSKTGIPIAVKPNNLNFTNTERDERIQIDEAVGNFKELIVDFFVWKSTTDLRAFSVNKQIQVIETNGDGTECQIGFHKDFSGKCVPDDPPGEIPRDKLIDTLKGFLFGTVALSLLARKY